MGSYLVRVPLVACPNNPSQRNIWSIVGAGGGEGRGNIPGEKGLFCESMLILRRDKSGNKLSWMQNLRWYICEIRKVALQ